MKLLASILLLIIFGNIAQAQTKFSDEYLKEYSWISMRNNILYSDNTFETKIGVINKNEKFELLDSYYLVYDFMVARISKIAKNSFDECENEVFQIGDEIEIIAGLGESQWAIIHDGEIKYASFNIDYGKDKLTDSSYDACNLISGDITKKTEKKELIVKVRTLNGEVGFIKSVNEGIYKNIFTDFIQSY